MKNLFKPKNIAIIGASADKDKLGYQITHNLIKSGFSGKIYPINLEEDKILGHKAYRTVKDVLTTIDLALIVVPREVVPHVLKDCVRKEIPTVVIVSSGFAEKDALGKKLQDEIVEIIENTKTKIIGPNCLGLINNEQKLNLTFSATAVSSGRISLILQSGAIGSAVFDWAKERQIGINKFISLGNKISINEKDVLEILKDDDSTKTIAIYLESIAEPIKFLKICREITNKPIILLKGGTTDQGALAASNHTDALSAPEELTKALLKQANVIIADNYEEFLNFLRIFAFNDYDFTHGSLAIVTNAGGPGILAVDEAAKSGFKLEKPTSRKKQDLKRILKNFASLENPFDIGGDADAERYEKIIRFLDHTQGISSIYVIVTPQSVTEIEKTAEVLARYKNSPKAVVGCFLGGVKIKKALEILQKAHIPHSEDPGLGVKMLAKIYAYERGKNHDLTIDFPLDEKGGFSEEELVKIYELPYTKSFNIINHQDVTKSLRKIVYPVVYKSATAIHRGKEDKIALNIKSKEELLKAVKNIGFPGILQQMVDSPYEAIIGAKRDPEFGITVLFGQGGIFVEEEKDISFRIHPLTTSDLDQMIEETNFYSIVEHLRVKPLFRKTIIDLIRLMIDNQDIKTIDMNPIKVFKKKIVAVDINITRMNYEK